MFLSPYRCKLTTYLAILGVEYWSATACDLSAKIDREGKVAIIHGPQGIDDSIVDKMVRQNTKVFFRVDWLTPPEELNSLTQDYEAQCLTRGCEVDLSDGICMCSVNDVSETAVFTSDDDVKTKSIQELLSLLPIGAVPPTTAGGQVMSGVTKYPNESPSADTIFEIVDQYGIKHYRKNLKSSVSIGNGSLLFRNPVHFISLSDPEPRDAIYETDAVLDQYFYHANTAPFLAIRFAQRFGISNPSPGYISRIANAFQTGAYQSGSFTFGTNEYGDLAATFAAVVLDREARSVVLDADPFQGSLLEPFLKIVRVMRSLEFKPAAQTPLVFIYSDLQDMIGQQPHMLPSVFSFFNPAFQPAGKCFDIPCVMIRLPSKCRRDLPFLFYTIRSCPRSRFGCTRDAGTDWSKGYQSHECNPQFSQIRPESM